MQKAADQVRVNVQLINAQTDSHLWAETYDRKLTDIFERGERDRQRNRGVVAGEADRSRGAGVSS